MRPHKPPEISEKQISELASFGCTMAQISVVAGVSVDTLERNYAEVIKKGREELNVGLMKKQIEVAMTGNVGMLIWLGKQRLGQSEKSELSGPGGGAIPLKIVNHIDRPLRETLERMKDDGK